MEFAETPTPAAPAGGQQFIVGRPEDVPEGERIIVKVGDREIGIFRLDGEFFALLHRCPHLGGPLCGGEVIGLVESDGPGDLTLDPGQRMLTCPWHGWEFDIKTGQSYWNPARTRARRFPIEIKEGSDLIDGQAEQAGRGGRIPGEEVLPGGRLTGQYRAETIPIEIKDEYLVVTVRQAPSRQDDARP